jgi:hypothetical protein
MTRQNDKLLNLKNLLSVDQQRALKKGNLIFGPRCQDVIENTGPTIW